MNWLDTIKMEIENMDDENLIEPAAEIGPNDHLVGKINDVDSDLKKIFSLAMSWEKMAMEKVVAARFINNSREAEHFIQQAEILHKKSEALMDVFWASIRDAFDLWGKPSIGIRKNWQVVWSDPEIPPAIIGLLGGLLR